VAVPDDVANDRALVRGCAKALIEQIATIHTVEPWGNGSRGFSLVVANYLNIELDHWSSEIRARQAGGTLPALELLVKELRAQQPEPCARVTLVHGDTKPGNFAFVDGEVSAVFDWEMATVGDPLADIGWAEVNWRFPGFVTAVDGAPSADELVQRWEALTGIRAQHRPCTARCRDSRSQSSCSWGGTSTNRPEHRHAPARDGVRVHSPLTQVSARRPRRSTTHRNSGPVLPASQRGDA